MPYHLATPAWMARRFLGAGPVRPRGRAVRSPRSVEHRCQHHIPGHVRVYGEGGDRLLDRAGYAFLEEVGCITLGRLENCQVDEADYPRLPNNLTALP